MGRIEGLGILGTAARRSALALLLASGALAVSLPAMADAQSAATQNSSSTAQPAQTASLAQTTSPTKSTTTKHKSSKHHEEAAKPAVSKEPADGCKPTPDQASIGLRALQTELMVAGLKCSAEQWNTFTAKFQKTIKIDADRLQKIFSKSYGKSGPNQMNAFVTQLANDASQRSNGYSEADYCKQEDVLYKKVLAFTNQELERFSAGRELTVPAPVALCKPDPADGAPAAQVTTVSATTPAPAPTDATLKR